MVDEINLKDFPRASGVYKIIWHGAVIYIGSSNDLYQRMADHRKCIKQGSDQGKKKGFYLFLQNNPFKIEYELTENYREREQDLINYYEPIYNERRSFTGCGTAKGRESEYMKERYQKFKDEHKMYNKQYQNQLVNYNGEILNLPALGLRFKKQGIPHPFLEAKKYLIS